MRSGGTALKLWMELAAKHEGMVLDLGNLDQSFVRREAGQHQARFGEWLSIFVVKLKTMPVSLVDDFSLVSPGRKGAFYQAAGITAQAHRASQVGNISLVGHQINDRIGGGGIKFS